MSKPIFLGFIPPRAFPRISRKFLDFLYYDCFEFVVILICVALILLIWEFTFWR